MDSSSSTWSGSESDPDLHQVNRQYHRHILNPLPNNMARQDAGRGSGALASPGSRSGLAGSRSRPSNAMPTIDNGMEWKKLDEVKIRILGLPRTVTTLDVYRLLVPYGTISRIDITTQYDRATYVVFRPAPSTAFWARSLCYRNAPLAVYLMSSRPAQYDSPITPGISYEECTTLYVDFLDFGFMHDETTMMKMQRAHSLPADPKHSLRAAPVELTLNMKRKELDVRFPLEIDTSYEEEHRNIYEQRTHLRFRLPISQLQRVYEVTRSIGKRSLIIPYNSPPQFYKQTRDIEATHDNHKYWSEWQTWFRQTDVVDNETSKLIEFDPVTFHNERAIIDIGRWTTYRLEFDESKMNNRYFAIRDILLDHNIQVVRLSNMDIIPRSLAQFWTLIDKPYSTFSKLESALEELKPNEGISLAFPVKYQLEVCLSNGWFNEYNIGRTFLERLSDMDPKVARMLLERVAERQTRVYNPMDIFKSIVGGDPVKKIPKYCVYTRAATVTPSMVYVATPVVETSNRIVRQYIEDGDRFLRVRFTDEKNEGKINSQDDNRSDDLFRRIKRAMTNGIVVAGRHYEFLAFGNSQFRENGAYFFCPSAALNSTGIRQWMGTFDQIKVVAKYAARVGQCFSTTRAITGATVEIKETPDIGRNGYTFTDGVGKISRFVAQMIANDLGHLKPFDDYPSLFQFRLGGCKGVLVVSPHLDGTKEIHIRPSQYKFPAVHRGLEVIRCSAFATACFNRQLIIVLSTLGVPDNVFLRKQQEMVNDLEEAIRNENKALQKLQRNVDFNQMTLTMAAMILDGFMRVNEPFMMSLLQLWRAFNIKFLKEKARILIDKGAFLLGCVDETSTLRGHYDEPQARVDATSEQKLTTLPEVFLQISDPEEQGKYKVVEGNCILARNPSLHPGDIRVVRAVDRPTLRHLKNVVVFPQTGDRDIANMCSGGDLDGDDYLVIWDLDFLPREINHPPMDFTPAKPVEVNGNVTVDDITTFFVTYMKTDSLGKIANAHLAQADLSDDGVCDENCLALAQLHSCAVDYPKSGIPAIMPRDLRPRKYPHFMENKWRPKEKIYRSQKVLGKLYDQVELVDFVPQFELPFDGRILDAFDLDDDILQAAREIKIDYDAAIRRIMAKHGIQTEFEVWSTFALEHNQESRDYTFAEELGQISSSVKHQFQDICRQKAGVSGLHRFVAAMYTVTAQAMETALKECHMMKTVAGQECPLRKMDINNMPLMSFPWVFHRELGDIAAGNSAGRHAGVLTIQREPKKYHKTMVDVAASPSAGDIQTSKGVTHFGDMLELFEDGDDGDDEGVEEVVIDTDEPSALQRLAKIVGKGISGD